MMSTSVKAWKQPIMPIMTTKPMMEDIKGSLMRVRMFHSLAPSMRAASMTSSEMPCNPERKMMMS